jgi:hypothetical protein
MVRESRTPSGEQVAILQWTARMGAVTAEAMAAHMGTTIGSARARLSAAERDRLVVRRQPLVRQPALYAITRAGLRASGLQGLDPCRVSAANALHLIVCSGVAAALERCYPDHRVLGERELRRDERERGLPLTSAQLGVRSDGTPQLHAPDLVLGAGSDVEPPVAVEVELTTKAPRRLVDICRAWARCRGVAGVLYLAPDEVARALERAIDRADAGERIVVAPLDALAWAGEHSTTPVQRTVSIGP